MSDFIESLEAGERRLLAVAAELREAREQAEEACRALDPGRMRRALDRLQSAEEAASRSEVSRETGLMAVPMKRYELIVTTVKQQTIYVTAPGPADAMFEAGKMADSVPGRITDQYMKLQEISE